MNYYIVLIILTLSTIANAGTFSCEGLFGLERPSEKELQAEIRELYMLKSQSLDLSDLSRDAAGIEYSKKEKEILLVIPYSEFRQRMRRVILEKTTVLEPIIKTLSETQKSGMLETNLLEAFKAEAGIRPDGYVGNRADTVLGAAIKAGREDVARILIKNKVDVNEMSDSAMPIHYAVEKSSIEFIEELISAGADINSLTRVGYNAMKIAAWHRSPDVIRLLHKHGASVNKRTTANDGWASPLVAAILAKRVENVRVLSELGAGLVLRSEGDRDAYARAKKDKQMISILENAKNVAP